MTRSRPHALPPLPRSGGYFPALERIQNGHAVAYFDGPVGTQVPRAVAEAMVDYLYHQNANTDWAYPTSAETDTALSGAREAFADFLNASASEIHTTAGEVSRHVDCVRLIRV